MADIKKGDSKNRLLSLQKELDRILADLLEPSQDRYFTRNRSLEVQVDVFETADALHVKAELPGVQREDINLFLSRDLLMIEGTKVSTYTAEKLRFLNLEREFGKFKREVGIPKPVDGRKIKAVFDNGILQILLPKISDRRGQRQRVPIESS